MPLKLDPMEDPALNLTPMVDVVLNLVMFFLVTTHFSKEEQEQQYPIELPKVTVAHPLTGYPEVVLNVAADGSIYVGKEQRTPEILEEELRAKVKAFPDQEVMIRGADDGPYQHVMTVLNICHRAGITKLRLANRALKGASP